MNKNDKNRQIDKKKRFQVALDIGWKPLLTILRAKRKMTIGSLVEHALSSCYAIDEDGNPYVIDEE